VASSVRTGACSYILFKSGITAVEQTSNVRIKFTVHPKPHRADISQSVINGGNFSHSILYRAVNFIAVCAFASRATAGGACGDQAVPTCK
jgi:hypothetical protein